MNLGKSVGKAFGGFLFSISVTLLILSIGLVEFTEYDNLKSIYTEIFSSQMGNVSRQVGAGYDEEYLDNVTDDDIREYYQTLVDMCEGKDYIELEIETGDPIRVDCGRVREGAGQIESGDSKEALGGIMASALFDNIYYKEYDCAFVKCIQSGEATAIFSLKANNYFKDLRIYSAGGIILGAILIIIFSETWPSRLKGLGWPLVFTGISYVLIRLGDNVIEEQLPNLKEVGIDIMPIIERMLQPMMRGFLIALIAGIALTAGGYIIQFKKSRNKGDSDK